MKTALLLTTIMTTTTVGSSSRRCGCFHMSVNISRCWFFFLLLIIYIVSVSSHSGHELSPDSLLSFQPTNFNLEKFNKSLNHHLRASGLDATPFSVATYNNAVVDATRRIPLPPGISDALGFVTMVSPFLVDILAAKANFGSNMIAALQVENKQSLIDEFLKQSDNHLEALTERLGGKFFDTNKILHPHTSYLDATLLLKQCGIATHVNPKDYTERPWYVSSGASKGSSFFLHNKYGGWSRTWGVFILNLVLHPATFDTPSTLKLSFGLTDELKRYAIARTLVDSKSYSMTIKHIVRMGFWKDVGLDSIISLNCEQPDPNFCDSSAPLIGLSPPPDTTGFTFLHESGSGSVLARFLQLAHNAGRYDSLGGEFDERVRFQSEATVEDTAAMAARWLFMPAARPLAMSELPRTLEYAYLALCTSAAAVAFACLLLIIGCCFLCRMTSCCGGNKLCSSSWCFCCFKNRDTNRQKKRYEEQQDAASSSGCLAVDSSADLAANILGTSTTISLSDD
eukprot:GHVS01076076.1.p1 GENE.GHVS01076076.1~~GHVS01076076.1.p1  ORF type:complete len:511 (+),score=63.70 GHVS01076076.1:119-1651(+)